MPDGMCPWSREGCRTRLLGKESGDEKTKDLHTVAKGSASAETEWDISPVMQRKEKGRFCLEQDDMSGRQPTETHKGVLFLTGRSEQVEHKPRSK